MLKKQKCVHCGARASAWKQAKSIHRQYPSVEKRYTVQEVLGLIDKYDVDVIGHINEAISRGLR